MVYTTEQKLALCGLYSIARRMNEKEECDDRGWVLYYAAGWVMRAMASGLAREQIEKVVEAGVFYYRNLSLIIHKHCERGYPLAYVATSRFVTPRRTTMEAKLTRLRQEPDRRGNRKV